jgi:hypothetical protein
MRSHSPNLIPVSGALVVRYFVQIVYVLMERVVLYGLDRRIGVSSSKMVWLF